jgi:hypothetical protein
MEENPQLVPGFFSHVNLQHTAFDRDFIRIRIPRSSGATPRIIDLTRPGKLTKSYGLNGHRNSEFSHEKWDNFPVRYVDV